jgi:hypothetical protein
MRQLAIAIALLLYCEAAGAAKPPAVAIRNAKVVTVAGPTLARGSVLLRNGLIEAVGTDLQIPPDAMVIDGEGLTVYPGLIDSLSVWGMPTAAAAGRGGTAPVGAAPAAAQTPPRGPEDRPSITSWVKAADEIQPDDRRITAARNAGFTTAVVFPTRGIFAGQGSIVNLGEQDLPGQMVIAPTVGQYVSLSRTGGGFPNSLMGVISYVRQIYLDAQQYALAKEDYTRSPQGKPRPAYDRALEGVMESKRILLPANTLVEIDRVLRLAQELKQPALFYGMREAYRPESLDLLKKGGAQVLVNLRWPEPPRDPDPDQVEPFRTLRDRDQAPAGPAALQKAGVRFALYSGGIEQMRDLNAAVKKAIDAGLPREDAVRALTLSPAEMFGVADRIGSIEKGKIANLVVTRGDLFEQRTRVEMVFIDGVRYIPPPEQAPAAGRGSPRNPGGDR